MPELCTTLALLGLGFFAGAAFTAAGLQADKRAARRTRKN